MSMKRKCDKCDRLATVHSVEVTNGKKIEKHLCELHAAEAGLADPALESPVNQLLNQFVQLHSTGKPPKTAACDECGMTFAEFREHSVLGCPHCYTAFQAALAPLVERAHGGATHHVGKVPRRAGDSEQHQQRIVQMRRRLEDAVAQENYELAAKLRDEITQYEEQSP